ncbi:serine hydrolase domain-containing protein [Spirochaeta dissipatitropha]
MEKLIEKIEEFAKATDFSGVVSVNRRDGAQYSAGFGYRNRAELLPNTAETRFGIASGTKLFTALGIGRLSALGKLDLNSRASAIDPRFKGFIHPEATVLELLTHTSGMYDYLDEELIEDYDSFEVSIPWYKLQTALDYLPLFEGHEPKFIPGERYAYSNGGYVLLACIIEIISGELYRDFITREILKPADMQNSGFFAFNELPHNTALGYLDKRNITNFFKLPVRGGGDGGMYTTAGDLDKFWAAFTSFRILPAELTEYFLKQHVDFNESSGYGCGVYLESRGNGRVYSIVGGDAGVGFHSQYSPWQQLSIHILSNITNGEERMRELLTSGGGEI